MSANYIRMTGAFLSDSGGVTVAGDKVGFRPSYVKITNEVDGATLEWFDSMGDDTGQLHAAGGGVSYLSADGLTPLPTGFELAASIVGITDADGEMLHFFALG